MGKTQREYFLRQQLKAIKEELGERARRRRISTSSRNASTKANLPTEAEKVANKELKRLRTMQAASSEYTVVRTYLDWIVDLPWAKTERGQPRHRERPQDPRRGPLRPREGQEADPRVPGRPQAEERHEGPDPLPRRPARRRQDLARPVASPARSGASSCASSLGGVRDEAEIRGHRRTYVGALPGRIIQGMKKAGTKNPVFMLDEIDKLGARLPRRSVGGAARGARSGAEQHASPITTSRCRSICRR